MESPRLEKAKRFLNAAHSLFENKHYESCVSRCYYALLHGALALLEKFNVQTEARKHRFVLSAFPMEFIHKRKVLTKETSDFLQTLYRLRNEADYDVKEFSEKTAKRLLDKTDKIVHSFIEVHNRAKP